MKSNKAIDDLLRIMARLRAPGGCPWDREQDHRSIRANAIEEVYELVDAIEAGDDQEMAEELGDLLLQVVFHCQMASERGAFDFNRVARHIADKLIRRHPHVFGSATVKNTGEVLDRWERIKHAEKKGTPHERGSALDGVPRHLPALLRAEKLAKKARKTGLSMPPPAPLPSASPGRREIAKTLFQLARHAQEKGWSAETLLREETRRQENRWRREERQRR